MNHDADDFFGGLEDLPLFQADPFADSTQKPTPEELAVGALVWRHKGRANPLPIARLRELTGYTERQIKGVIEQLIVTHRMQIGARREDPAGYFMIQNAEDLDAAVRPYKSQILAMVRRLRVLDPSHHSRLEFMGQIRCELEGK